MQRIAPSAPAHIQNIWRNKDCALRGLINEDMDVLWQAVHVPMRIEILP